MLLRKHIPAALAVSLVFSTCAYAKAPENLHWAQMRIKNYVSSGAYMADMTSVDHAAEHALKQSVAQHKKSNKLAMVLDIDETSLSNYKQIKAAMALGVELGDTLPKNTLSLFNHPFKDPAIAPTLELYRYAIHHGVHVFFITGRYAYDKKPTAMNLKAAGYHHWDALILRKPSQLKESTIAYKSSERKKIAAKGYDIVVNVGDQFSDLKGGYAQHVFKLPDPFYYIP
jgi:predicted secreted acid phosphatase